jgi:hypothetical protein
VPTSLYTPILHFAKIVLQEQYGSQELDMEALEDTEDADALSELVEGLLDDLLERVDSALDRARALIKHIDTPGKAAPDDNVGAALVAG